MIRVYLVEDQALVRGAVAALLGLDENIQVIGQAENGKVALAEIPKCKPDIVLTDIEMPELSGIELAEKLAIEKSESRIVIMTTFSKAGYIRRSLDAGVKGFILKEASSDSLILALKKVMSGHKVIDPELVLSALDDRDPLTEKERASLKLAAEGLKTQMIAAKLYLSEGTVRNYLSEAISKLNASNRIDAARIAKRKGWL
ncbi:response regulator transcription factor [Pseudoalteromonas sp. N1230-9]|jgi:two-component system response regulator DesR|uniref:Response regulator transcription factor n=1 Tax=Pseudoalteromonas lipolytica TaxID=570156 RepID=A0A0P7EKR1_9GAMM|nr:MULTISPECIES: response regulator transcription factor [Pseudoalteromonas]MED5511447.1 response regulator transcription factor [Pseudomonadota bacterium]WOC25744.1 response regulator transcription factor [Pseudoalteromonas sp. N1230-9]KPM83789.1 transcriptional regulator [Pseudoalteromonas lipolytica]MBC7010841.1 response regulator transcription factor [Pseudoalteromonas sp. BZK2]MCF2916014.1 response regulator transcription factor [Pseudoalteromonas sp. Cn5-37]